MQKVLNFCSENCVNRLSRSTFSMPELLHKNQIEIFLSVPHFFSQSEYNTCMLWKRAYVMSLYHGRPHRVVVLNQVLRLPNNLENELIFQIWCVVILVCMHINVRLLKNWLDMWQPKYFSKRIFKKTHVQICSISKHNSNITMSC